VDPRGCAYVLTEHRDGQGARYRAVRGAPSRAGASPAACRSRQEVQAIAEDGATDALTGREAPDLPAHLHARP
jgi:hypothetical protein